jgi:hydrogenase nickel incorporation protein HypA/HybF
VAAIEDELRPGTSTGRRIVHELSIAAGVVDVALSHCGGRRVTAVNVRVGALRQVVPATLLTAFDAATRDTACDGAELHLELISARLSCPTCACEWTPDEPVFRCQGCHAPAVVLAGRELEIESIEVDDS